MTALATFAIYDLHALIDTETGETCYIQKDNVTFCQCSPEALEAFINACTLHATVENKETK